MTTALERFTSFSDLTAMERRLRRLIEDVGFAPALAPAADVYETDGEYVVELEVPGYDEKELSVSIAGHTLVVEGERKQEIEEKEKTHYLHERLEKHFERRFALPEAADIERLDAGYEKGVLSVHVPKTAAAAPRKVEITTAAE